jgi:hypothetical protein
MGEIAPSTSSTGFLRVNSTKLGLAAKEALEEKAMPVYEFKCGKCDHLFEVMGSYT